jgi:hypothetical protein
MEESDDGAGDPRSATLGNRAACTDRSALCILLPVQAGTNQDYKGVRPRGPLSH